MRLDGLKMQSQIYQSCQWHSWLLLKQKLGQPLPLCKAILFQKMQLDVDVSPPANIMTLRLGLTNELLSSSFCLVTDRQTKFHDPRCNTFRDMNYYQVWILVKWRQTDRKRCTWAHRAVCTGGLKNCEVILRNLVTCRIPVWANCEQIESVPYSRILITNDVTQHHDGFFSLPILLDWLAFWLLERVMSAAHIIFIQIAPEIKCNYVCYLNVKDPLC